MNRQSLTKGLARLILAGALTFTTQANAEKYVIKQGDTYTSIAKQKGVSVDSLLRDNPNIEPRKLQIGQSINYNLSTNESNSLTSKISSYSTSQTGIDSLKSLEGGFRSKKYVDADGYSIGYGHFILPNENYDSGINKEKAEEILRSDLREAEKAVKRLVKVDLNQNQFDALVSLTYNMGQGNFAKSSLLEKINANDFSSAANLFGNYIYSKGKLINSLKERRQVEKEMFLKNN